MPVYRYRRVQDMPPPWRAADDPGNLRRVAEMMALHRRLVSRREARAGVQRFRSIDEASTARADPLRHPAED